ncbi:hypothetical protein [Mycobacterium sp.]|uniref:hypothetical protein n=1 Tax=Mycobacterium sp. TaxID=1785 RepID=UPI003F9B3BE5
MTETTTERPRDRRSTPFWAQAAERQRCRVAAECEVDPYTLKPIAREPRSALQLATAHAKTLEATDDLLSCRERIAFTSALAALSQAESASRSATALESIAAALAALADTAA